MIIENPIEWQKVFNQSNTVLTREDSECFWETVKQYGIRTKRSSSRGFDLIWFFLNEDEDFLYYFQIKTNQEVFIWNLSHETEQKEQYFETELLRKSKDTDEWHHSTNESSIPFIMDSLDVISPISFIAPFSIFQIRLDKQLGLGLELSTQGLSPHIEFRFIELQV